MDDADLYQRFILTSSVAAGGCVAGVWLLLFAPKRWPGRAAAAAAGVSATSGLVGLLAADLLPWVGGLAAVAAAACVAVGTPTARRVVAACVRPLARVRVFGGVAVAAAFGVWGYEAWQFDAASERRMDESMVGLTTETAPVATHPAGVLLTDRGAKIELTAPTAPMSAGELLSAEKNGSVVSGHSGRIIRRGPPADESNCHGWVFTGGQFNLGGRFVETILTDNGYVRVSTPTAGDVCVYRGADGGVSHTGVVRGVLDDGTVMVESKWGRMGVYLHGSDDSCYGSEFAYHRTARGTHLLSGLAGVSDATHAADELP